MSEQLKRNIGQRVKSERLQRGLTQAELAEAIDKAFETISNIERGKTAPSFSTLSDISDVLGMPMRAFFEFEDANLPEERQELLLQLSTLVGQMDDARLSQFLKLGRALSDP